MFFSPRNLPLISSKLWQTASVWKVTSGQSWDSSSVSRPLLSATENRWKAQPLFSSATVLKSHVSAVFGLQNHCGRAGDGSQLLVSIVGCGPMEDLDIVFPAHFSSDYLLHTCHYTAHPTLMPILILPHGSCRLPFEVLTLDKPFRVGSLLYSNPQLTGTTADTHRAGARCVWEAWQALTDERVSADPRRGSTRSDHISSQATWKKSLSGANGYIFQGL